LYLNRETIADLVKLYDEPAWWTFTKVEERTYSVVCKGKCGFADVYCPQTFLNPSYVYADGGQGSYISIEILCGLFKHLSYKDIIIN